MPNPEIGELTCPMGGHRASVRRYKSGAALLYWSCACGIIRPALAEGQEWILQHAKLHGPAELVAAKPEPAPAPIPVREEPPAPAPTPAPIPVREKPQPAKPTPVKKPPASPAPPKPATRRSLLPDL